MKLVFAGTPDFARAALDALIAAGHEIVLVLTQPDRPSGRGMQVHPGAVKARAASAGIDVLQPRGLRLGGRHDEDAQLTHRRLRETPHDAMIVAAYGLILPQAILDTPPRGCINVHASLLPRWRGAAPVQRAIEAGDSETGITIMRMDAGLDTGPMLLVSKCAIDASDNAATLTDRLARLGGDAIVDALALLERGDLEASPQHAPGDESQVRYAAKVTKDEAALDFRLPSRVLVDRIRAFDPWPGSTARLVDQGGRPFAQYKVWRAEEIEIRSAAALTGLAPDNAAPGRVLGFLDAGTTPGPGLSAREAGAIVKTSNGAIVLTELQKAGGKRLPARAFARDFVVDDADAANRRVLHFAQRDAENST